MDTSTFVGNSDGINYYKGVLLCSRPNENPSISKKKDFCGRVFPRQQLGLVPVKEYDQHKTKKRVLPVLNNHKKWLEKFKKEVQEKKQDEEKEKERAAERLQKIKHEGHEEREKARQATIEATNPQNTTEATKNNKEDTAPPGKNEPSLKKKQKPAWAKTANENEKHQQKEVEELLDFFNKQQEKELQDYVSDGEVKNILIELKGKIQRLKEQQNWRNHQIKKMEDDKKKEERQKDNNDDVLSRISKQSAAQSVSSHKTAERIQQLQKKKKDVDWDKMTGTQKKTMASVDEQIAKNIADELLRNYPNLKHHSNQSIRQLIQKHAHQQIKS